MREGAAARQSTILLAIATLLFAVYGLPLLWPPAAAPLLSPEPDASLLARLFPNVPAWWIALRLICLLAAGVLAAAATHGPDIPWARPDQEPPGRPPAMTLNAALVAACLLVLAAAQAESLGRLGQTLFLPALLVPVLLVGASEHSARIRTRERTGITLLLAVLCIWLAIRLPAALGSPRCADPIDMWTNFAWLTDAVGDGRNLLTSSSQPGLSDAWMLLQGISLLPHAWFSFEWFQTMHFVWLVLTAVALWDAVATMLGRAAAAVATAVLLFSPFFASLPYSAAPFGVMTFLAAAMLALLARVYVRRSISAAMALGPAIGLSATLPHLVPLAGFVATSGLYLALRSPRLPLRAMITAILLSFAVVLPTLPDVTTFEAMMEAYVARNSEWQGLEAVLLGQRSVDDVRQLYVGGTSGPVDVALGALVAPFAIPRTPLRLWGDSLLDPVGAALLALGLAACSWRLRRDRWALFALVLMTVSISPGLVSGYNRTSLHRMVAGPVVWAALAAVGYTVLRRGSTMQRQAALFAGVIALGGTLLFDVVNPRIVPASWLSIALEANAGLVAGGKAVFLEYGRPSRPPWLHVETISRHLAEQPADSRPFVQASDLEEIAATGVAVLYWSPALEEDFQVRGAVCGRWPEARVYVLRDAAGISTAWAAQVDDSPAAPSLPQDRWSARGCGKDKPDLSDLSDAKRSM